MNNKLLEVIDRMEQRGLINLGEKAPDHKIKLNIIERGRYMLGITKLNEAGQPLRDELDLVQCLTRGTILEKHRITLEAVCQYEVDDVTIVKLDVDHMIELMRIITKYKARLHKWDKNIKVLDRLFQEVAKNELTEIELFTIEQMEQELLTT